MDTRSRIPSIERRLDQVEHEVHILQENQAALARTVALMEASAGSVPIAEIAPETRAAPAAPPLIFCPDCHRSNAADAAQCVWCRRPLLLASQAAAPEAPRVPAGPSVPVAPEAGGALDLMREAVPLLPCPHCHNGNPPEARSCRRCGILLAAPAAPGSAVAAAVPLAEVESATAAPVAGELAEAETPAPTEPIAPLVPEVPESPRARPSFDFLGKSEFWLNKVGIGLLLLGLAYFFKYSIDKGWLNEPVRIGLGLALGTLLLGTGLAFHAQRRHFSQVLLGGSIATYYITGFAAYELFHLVPYGWAFGFMAVVTALAFALAVRQDEAILALIGVAGGLLTPFVLTGSAANVTGLMVYTCVVLAGATAIYFFRGWRSLLWLSFAGGWAVFLLGWQGTVGAGTATIADRWALQGAALFGLLAFWAVPVLSEVYAAHHPDRRSVPVSPAYPDLAQFVKNQVYMFVIAVPLITLGFSRGNWESLVNQPVWGWLTVAGALAYGAVAWALRRPLPNLSYAHSMMAILLGTLGLVQILEGDALFLALAVEATALLFVARRLADRGTEAYGYLIWAGSVSWLGIHLLNNLAIVLSDGGRRASLVPDTGTAITDLVVIVLLAVASFAVGRTDVRALCRNLVHLAFVAWIGEQLAGQPYAVGWTMLAWAVYAVLLNMVYHRWPARFTPQDTITPSHLIFAAAAGLFALDIMTGQAGAWSVFNLKTLHDVAFVAMLAGMSFVVRPVSVKTLYRLVVHMGVLGLLWRELWVLPNGPGLVMLTWALYAVGLNLLYYKWPVRFPDDDTTLPSHLIFAAATGLGALNIETGQAGVWSVFNVKTLLDVAFVVILAGVSFVVRPSALKTLYRLVVHMGVLGLLWRELWVLPNGPGLVMLTWALYAVGLNLLHNQSPVRFPDDDTTIPAHLIFLLTGGWFILDILQGQVGEWAVFNVPTLIDAAVVAIVAGMSFFVRPARMVPVYRIAAHAGVLALLWRELGAVQDGPGYVMLTWAAYLTLVQYLARRGKDQVTAGVAHVPFLIVAAWLAVRLLYGAASAIPLVNLNALLDLAVIALALGTSLLVQPREVAWTYRFAAHLAILGWFWRELVTLENGQALVTVAWGAYALAVVVGGLWGRRRMPLVYAGLATLFVVLGKLFLVDLAAIDPLWRVLLFLGFGGVFLWLSYFFQNAISGKPRRPRTPGLGRLHWPGRPAH